MISIRRTDGENCRIASVRHPVSGDGGRRVGTLIHRELPLHRLEEHSPKSRQVESVFQQFSAALRRETPTLPPRPNKRALCSPKEVGGSPSLSVKPKT